MSTRSYAVRDSVTMLRRNLRHALRYPSMTLTSLLIPVLILLLFVGVYGGTLGAGIGGPNGGTSYIAYVAPAIILMATTSGSVSTAVSVALDMSEGIINRFRTMPIARASVLTGHVVGSVIQTLISIGLLIGVAVLMGFRPTADPVEWVAAIGLLTLVTLALTWLSAGAGLAAKSVEGASNLPTPVVLLPLISSGFVPTESMPAGVAWFAEHQPFTPIIETLRGLLLGTPIGNNAIIALAWCVGIALIGYLWARALFNRDPSS
ncbi:MAG TPA: ABC transporter permease, partial [Jiangellaceae bacterium]|nr:ABC transporter permease [Jiangellaceae bacterium]